MQIYEIPTPMANFSPEEIKRELAKEWRKEVAEHGFAKCPNAECQLCFLSSKGMMKY